jgi:hypothetical protein
MTFLGFIGLIGLTAIAWGAMQFAIWLAHKLKDGERP